MRRDQRASTAMEFALTFPIVLLFIFGMFAAFSLICCKRAMDVGVEKALRYAIANSAQGAAQAQAKCTSWASVIWNDVGQSGSCVVTFSTSTPKTVTATYTYNWRSPASLSQPENNSIFNPVTLTTTATMQVMN